MSRAVIHIASAAFFIAVFTSAAAAQPRGYVAATGFADVREFGSTTSVPYYGEDFSLDTTGAGGRTDRHVSASAMESRAVGRCRVENVGRC